MSLCRHHNFGFFVSWLVIGAQIGFNNAFREQFGEGGFFGSHAVLFVLPLARVASFLHLRNTIFMQSSSCLEENLTATLAHHVRALALELKAPLSSSPLSQCYCIYIHPRCLDFQRRGGSAQRSTPTQPTDRSSLFTSDP